MGLEAIEKFYKKSVKEEDKKGFAKKYKDAMKAFIKTISKSQNVTFENIEYLDGYYIFGKGTNSIVHFELKETPNWKYGIWWSIPKKVYNNVEKKMIQPIYVEGIFFAQYKDIIDKFKPSASTIQSSFTIVPEDKYNDIYHIGRYIDFIRTEPYLAFCRDYDFQDYNMEYLSRRKAKHIFKEWKRTDGHIKKWEQKLNDRFMNFVRNMFDDVIKNDDMCILDRGEDWSPSHQIYIKKSYFPENNDLICGCYSLFNEDNKDLKAKWDKMVKKLDKFSDRHNLIWYKPVDDDFILVDDKNWNKSKELEEENGKNNK